MFELLRKLTANYTEEEYKEWLAEPVPEDNEDHTTAHRISWCEGLKCWIDLDGDADKWYYEPKLKFESLKDVVSALQKVAYETGYLLTDLCDEVEELVKEDGQTYEEAVSYVAGVSYEHDW